MRGLRLVRESARHERQAREVGRKAVHGRARVPAWSVAQPGTPRAGGGPLPAATRRWLETALDADLAAVRFHDDRGAHAAAAAAGALALARGCHIEWGAQAPALHDPAGRELIAHEVAHVLQQTAMRAPDGRWRATDRRGGGDAQPAKNFQAELAAAAVFTSPPAVADLIKDYLANYQGDFEVINVVSLALHDPTPSVDTTEIAKLGAGAAALHVDLCKVAGDDGRAMKLAAAHDYALPTAYRREEFYRTVVGKDASGIAKLALGPARAELGRVLDGLSAALLSPTTDPDSHFVDVDWASQATVKGVAASELLIGARRALHDLSGELRTHVLKRIEKHDEDPTTDAIDLRRRTASDIANAKKSPLTPAAAEASALAKLAWGDIRTRAGLVRDYWDRVASLRKAPKGDPRRDAAKRELGKTKLDAALVGVLEAVDLEALTSADPAAFEAALQTAADDLATAGEPFATALLAVGAGDLDEAKADAPGLALHAITRLSHALRTYSARRDRALTDLGLADARDAVVIAVASVAQSLANDLGLAKVKAWADECFKVSRLAISGEWTEIAVKDGQLSTEMGSRPASLGATGLTWALIEDALRATRDEHFADALSEAMVMESPGRIRGNAEKEAAWPDRPRRFEATAQFWNIEKDTDDATGGSALVMNHRLVYAQGERIGGDQALWAVPPIARNKLHDKVVMWVLPRADRLVDRLRNIEGLDARVMKKWRGKGQPNPWEWLYTLKLVVADLPATKTKGKLDRPELAGKIREQITDDRDTARWRRQDAWRRATILDRPAVVTSVAGKLAGYSGARDEFPTVREAFGQIDTFLGTVIPKTDRAAHAAALALALVDDLARAFSGKYLDTHAESVRRVAPFVTGALSYWDDPAGHDAIIKAHEGLGHADLDKRAERLRKLARRYRDYVTEAQRGDGFVAVASGDSARLHHVLGEQGALAMGQVFQVDKFWYRIAEIHQDFVFHPQYNIDEGLAGWKDGVAGRPLLYEADGKTPWTIRGEKLLTYTSRRDKSDKVTTIVVTDKDLDRLADVEELVGLWHFIGRMKQTGAAIEWVFNRVLDLAEFIPGIGQGITLARFGLAILDFIEKGELQRVLEIIQTLNFKNLVGELESRLDPVNLLFSFLDSDLDVKHQPTLAPEYEELSQKKGPWTKIARAAKSIARMGGRILEKVARAQTVSQGSVNALQGLVATHHGAAVLASLIEKHADLAAITVAKLGDGGADLVPDLGEAATELVAGGRTAMDGLLGFTLPEELLPLEVVIDFIVDMVVDNLGGKYEAIAKGSKWLLEKLGIWQEVLGKVDSLIKGGFDPNQAYRDAMEQHLSPLLEKARSEVGLRLAQALREIPLLSDLADPSPGDPVTVGFDAEETIDMRPADGEPAPHPAEPGLARTTRGGRLPVAARAWAEGAIGHDLSHVRVHRDPAADALTRAAGAYGLTTGSHVLLRGDLDLRSRLGRGVLAHELGHVVQQTGARPLDQPHSDRASPGRPGRGLSVDAGREAEAEAVSRRALDGGPRAGLGTGDGVQPTFGPFLRRFVGHLRRTDKIRERADDAKQDHVAPADLKVGKKLVTSLLAKLKSGAVSAWPATFRTKHGEILGYLKGRRDELDQVAGEAVEEARDWVKQRGKKDVGFIRPAVIANHLRDLVFGLTGIGLQIEMTPNKGTGPTARRQVLKESDPFSKVVLKYVHLGFIGSTSALWKDAVKASFTEKTPLRTEAMFRIAARSQLALHGVSVHVWDKQSYKLSDAFVVAVTKILDDQDPFPPSELPKKKDYLEMEPGNVSKTGDHGHIGLRYGTYADRKAAAAGTGGAMRGAGRDAHHLTQWLVVQYLSFRHHEAPLAYEPGPKLGVTWNDSGIATITAGNDKIDFGAFTANRGGLMPVLLLSRHAHHSGIHIGDEPDEKKDRPSTLVAREFNERARATLLPLDKPPQKEADKTAFPNRLLTTVRETYAWGLDKLEKSLLAKVPAAECDYYRWVAEEANKPDRIEANDVRSVCQKALRRNDSTMAGWGLPR